jgi:Holliday junction DNA helicase RuvA
MIGKLTGLVDTIAADHAIIDVGGVGYLVHCPSSTLARMTMGAGVTLAIETKLSEEAIRLYGFISAQERDWFRLLQTVQGVGARVALSILSALKPAEIERAIVLGDKSALGRAQGVGPKLAMRITAELKDKVSGLAIATDAAQAGMRVLPGAGRAVEAEAIAALVKLGYTQSAASDAVARAAQAIGPNAEAMPLDVLIRESLRLSARM